MILSDTSDIDNGLVQQVHLTYKGNNRWPNSGEAKYNRIRMIANRKLKELVNKGNKDWSFFWSLSTIGTVAVNDQDYNLASAIKKLSDYVYLYDGSTEYAKLEVRKPKERGKFPQCVYLSGNNPRILNFAETLSAGHNYLGKTIKAGVYSHPTALSATTDTIPLNDPEWLVYEVAAELARNDPAKDDQFGNLQGIANDKYLDMVATDEGCPFEQITQAAIVQPRVT